MKWYDVNNAAEISSSIDYNCNLIEHALGEKLIIIFSAFIFFTGSWIVAFIYCIELTLLAFSLLFLQFCSGYLIHKTTVEAAVIKQEQYKTAGGIVEESLEGIKTVASNNAQEQRTKEYKAELLPLSTFTTRTGFVNGLGWGLFFSSIFAFTGILYFVGAYLNDEGYEIWITNNEVTAATLIAIYYATSLSSYYLSNALPCLDYINSGVVAASMIDEEIDQTKKFDGNYNPESL